MRVSGDGQEKFVKAIVRPCVADHGEGAAVGEDDGGLHLPVETIPGEGLEEFRNLKKPALDPELAGNDGQVTDFEICGEIVGHGETP